ncbi:unnamed protein product [Colias eurytheme]|nr:unnamed protein product [Colias eurytheme]
MSEAPLAILGARPNEAEAGARCGVRGRRRPARTSCRLEVSSPALAVAVARVPVINDDNGIAETRNTIGQQKTRFCLQTSTCPHNGSGQWFRCVPASPAARPPARPPRRLTVPARRSSRVTSQEVASGQLNEMKGTINECSEKAEPSEPPLAQRCDPLHVNKT